MQIIYHSNDKLHILAHAKINLFLDVLKKRDDGYHEIETLMQEINLHDELILKKTTGSLTLKCSGSTLPTHEENLVWQAVRLLREVTGIDKEIGVEINLIKNIPIGAGLGGGSTDAAATLKGLNILYDLRLTQKDLLNLAARLGSDVPFFILGGTAVCRGRGEIVTPLRGCQPLSYVLFCPGIHISTKTIYENLKLNLTSCRNDVTMLYNQLMLGCPEEIGKLLYNRLETAVFELYPAIRKFAQELSSYGFCKVLLSGSGSSIFGVCRNRNEAEEIGKKLANTLNGVKVVVTQS